MLRVFICEDDEHQLKSLTELVNSFIKEAGHEMPIAMNTQFPDEIIAILPLQNTTGLYFLDIDLSCDIDAYKLSTVIREHDPRAFIVIVTSRTDEQSAVLKHGVEPMDYIIKGAADYDESIKACIEKAYSRHITRIPLGDEFIIKLAVEIEADSEYLSRGSRVHLNTADILCIEMKEIGSHYITFHMRNGKHYVVRKTLKAAEQEFSSTVTRCHKSCLVNKNDIVAVDRAGRKLTLTNGQNVYVGRDYVNEFIAFEKSSK